MLSVAEPEPVEGSVLPPRSPPGEAAPAEEPRGLVKKKLLKADDDDENAAAHELFLEFVEVILDANEDTVRTISSPYPPGTSFE